MCSASRLTLALQTGASFALRKRGGKGSANVQAPPAWVVSADDGDGELVDEEALLTEEDRQRPTRPVGPDDCEVRLLGVGTPRPVPHPCAVRLHPSQVGAAGRKACANCTCGRADAEKKDTVMVNDAGADATELPKSACGSVRALTPCLLCRFSLLTRDRARLCRPYSATWGTPSAAPPARTWASPHSSPARKWFSAFSS